jgi:hypothetical protein
MKFYTLLDMDDLVKTLGRHDAWCGSLMMMVSICEGT